jgi:hypothetical protein
MKANQLIKEESQTKIEVPLINKKYKCIIESIEKESFWARVEDCNNVEFDELIEFNLQDISESDRSLIQEGVIFLLNVEIYKKKKKSKL